MSTYQIIDTFPEFLDEWEKVMGKPVETQIDQWASINGGRWPELLEKQLDNYVSAGEDWKEIARSKIFPYGQRLTSMQKAHAGLLSQCPIVYDQAVKRLHLDYDILFVVYAGIGCGAGWVTRYQDKAAVLFGLENIADEGWEALPVLAGLIAHEIGHIAHTGWRNQKGLPELDGPWWDLYLEGFAQCCEQAILEGESWHMSGASGWLEWCQSHRSWLAAEFIHAAELGNTKPFFGSWFNILGYRQSGYYLGHEVVRAIEAEESLPLTRIALLEDTTMVREKTNKIAIGAI